MHLILNQTAFPFAYEGSCLSTVEFSSHMRVRGGKAGIANLVPRLFFTKSTPRQRCCQLPSDLDLCQSSAMFRRSILSTARTMLSMILTSSGPVT